MNLERIRLDIAKFDLQAGNLIEYLEDRQDEIDNIPPSNLDNDDGNPVDELVRASHELQNAIINVQEQQGWIG